MSGLNCPQCGAKGMVTDSRPHPKGIRRRRACANGHRYSSLEQIEVLGRMTASASKPRATRINLMTLPLTYLTIEQKKRAKQFFAAGWTLAEVAPLFDMKPADLRK